MTWLVVALVAVALIAIGAYVMERQRSAALRRRFGPEYERALGEADGNRRAAETQLRERLRRRAAVELRDLEPAARARYSSRWRAVQMGFVDDPAGAVAEAAFPGRPARGRAGLRRRRRPTATAPSIGTSWWPSTTPPWWRDGTRRGRPTPPARSDDLRQAFLQQRALFQALLGEGAGEDPDRGRARRPVVTEKSVVRP